MLGEFFVTYGAWLWLALGILLIVTETLVPGMHFIWFGLAALAVGSALLTAWFDYSLQLLAFGILSMVTVYFGKRLYGHKMKSDQPNLNERGLDYVGRTALVETPINGGRGRVRLGDTVWAAEGADMPAGTSVTVTGINGTVLVVAKA
ncbi:MAG: NfeD family protein [Hyphomicrobiaceae bacterium]|nr:NfeD family protein [Hyphomicrobiaceae bacterium]